MAHIYSHAESPRRDSGDSLQLTNLILDSGDTCHMTPNISIFILVSMVETDNYIEVVDGHFVTAKQTGEVQIKLSVNNGKPSIDTLCNILFDPDLCDLLFFNNKIINSGHT